MSRKTCSLKVSCKARTSSVAVGAVLLTWADVDVECFKSGQVEKKYFWEYLDTNQVQDFFYNFCRERMKCRVRGKGVVEEKIWRGAAKECKRTWRNFSASAKDIYPTRVQQQYFQHHTCTCSYLACRCSVSLYYYANQIWCWSTNLERKIVLKGWLDEIWLQGGHKWFLRYIHDKKRARANILPSHFKRVLKTHQVANYG